MKEIFTALLVVCLTQASAGWTGASPQPASPFDRGWLEREAERLAGEAYREPRRELPKELTKADYDQYRALRARPEGRLWYGEALEFSVDLLPPGWLFRTPVEVHIVEDGQAIPVPFDVSRFDFGALEPVARASPDLFYSGFRVRYPLNRPDIEDEFLVFQGASYFRAVGRGNLYGLSARGLSVDTAHPEGEEFPRFSRFWIERPEPESRNLVIHALLDSPSAAGAYTFVVTPGEATVLDVQTVLYPRRTLHRAGLATLTSMFLYNAVNRSEFFDYRSAVHDSHGLQIVTGSWMRLWRPLANPSTVQVSSFADRNPRGFGLVQRHRDFSDYEDAEARYERRPSLWIQPLGDWGEGSVELVEIPTRTEYNDNIVALWRPAKPLPAGQRMAFAYRMLWNDLPPDDASLARVAATRIGAANHPGAVLFVVDFTGLDRAAEPLPDVSSSAGRLSNVTVQALGYAGRHRVAFELEPGSAEPAELRLVLRGADGDLSETWLYRWTRPE